MAYDERLYARLKAALAGEPVAELRMMGGVGFTLGGHMVCGVHGDRLVVRVGPGAYPAALAEPHAAPFDITGRPMTGWVMVTSPGVAADAALAAWTRRALAFVRTLPAK